MAMPVRGYFILLSLSPPPPPFYKRGNCGFRKIISLPKVAQLGFEPGLSNSNICRDL